MAVVQVASKESMFTDKYCKQLVNIVKVLCIKKHRGLDCVTSGLPRYQLVMGVYFGVSIQYESDHFWGKMVEPCSLVVKKESRVVKINHTKSLHIIICICNIYG